MERNELEILNALDPAKLTLDDLRQVKNSVLRQALFSAIQALVVGGVSGAQHTNHWAFTSHAKALLVDVIFPEVAGGVQLGPK